MIGARAVELAAETALKLLYAILRVLVLPSEIAIEDPLIISRNFGKAPSQLYRDRFLRCY